MSWFSKFIYSKEEGWVFARTLVESLLGWLIANIGDVFNLFTIDSGTKTLIMGAVVLILTEVLSYIRSKAEGVKKEENTEEGENE